MGIRRIGVWNTAFLGDAVLTLPLLQSLQVVFPSARIDFYVRGGFKDLFVDHPVVSSVVSFDKRGKQKGFRGGWEIARYIGKQKYDLWLSPHTSLRSSMMALASKARVRIGYEEAVASSLCYTHRVARRFGELDEIERLLELLAPLNSTPASHWPEIFLPQHALEAAEIFFSTISGPVVGLHPGSVWPTKRWPAAYFAEVGVLAAQKGATVLVFGGFGEEAFAAEVCRQITACGAPDVVTRVHNLSGQLSLVELAAYLARLSCYVTNDSGPMHLAWAQRVPVCAIFGPTVRELGFFPRGEQSHVFETALDCRPCGLHGHVSCPQGHHNCMRQVAPQEIWKTVEALCLSN